MLVRPARLDDAAQIAEIHVRSWQLAYRGLVPQEYLDAIDLAARQDRWAESLAHPNRARGGTFVAVDDGGVILGFAHAELSRDDDAAAGTAEVWAIYLAPDSWRQGIGRRLLSAVTERLTDIGYAEVTLWVLADNARARRFYEAVGFRPDAEAKVDDRRGFPVREVRYRRSLP
jgi:ribosomal protein S18 acetylase RimI-like enzyme